MPYTDRLDYFCSMTNNWAYALSVEKLAGIEVPERAEYLRVILAELTRLQNHGNSIPKIAGQQQPFSCTQRHRKMPAKAPATGAAK